MLLLERLSFQNVQLEPEPLKKHELVHHRLTRLVVYTSLCSFYSRLMIILPKLGNTKHIWDDPDLTVLRPHAKGTGRFPVSLAQCSALHRAFFFLCKMARVSGPVLALCRYDLLSHRSRLHVTGMVDGLCCWPEVLLLWPNFGKIRE